ncbi:MAG: zf-TFIIB domain-containing protein [Anaerolineales bacterium]
MNCMNCGAPMQLMLEKQHFYCDYCTSLYFPDENEDGIRILDEISETDCPVCRTPLVYGFIDQTQTLYCQSCRGMLIDQESFLMVIEYLHAKSTQPPIDPPAVKFSELERKLICPTCGRHMSTHLYGGPGNLVVDNCGHCLHLWLDNKEFARIIRAPGRERPARDDEDEHKLSNG